MLLQQDNGSLVGKAQHIVDITTQPTAFEYGSQPLYKERTFIFRPVGGFGERVQTALADKRYYFCVDMWVVGGLMGKGPLTHQLVPTTTGSIRQFVDAPDPAGASVQFILAGATVLRRSDDTSAGQIADHTRAGHTALSAIRFRAQGTTPVNAMYVAWDDGVLEQRSPAGVWVTCTLPSGFNANLLAAVGPQLVAADSANAVVRICTNDPTVAGSWGGPIFVGNPSTAITSISAAANKLIIFKADGGIYTLNQDGTTNDEVPGARVPISASQAWPATPWLNAVYCRIGPTFWQIDMPSVNLTPVGPERQLDNGSIVLGRVVAFCGWGAITSFGMLYNSHDNASYLMTYGSWNPDASDNFTFSTQWDGAVAHWNGRQATALGVSNASGSDRLYIGFSDGGYDWIKLTPNPLALNNPFGAEFITTPAYIVAPLHTAMFENDTKAWTGVGVFGPQITTSDYVNVSYRLMGTAGGPQQSPSNDYIDLAGNLNYSGFRLDFPPNINGAGLSVKFTLTNADSTRTPVLEGMAIYERVIPRFRLDFSGTIDARDWVARRDGAVMRQAGHQIRQLCQAYVASPNLALIEIPDETLDSVAIFDYTERLAPWKQGGSAGWLIDFQASQFATLSVYGIIRRLSGTLIQDLSGYTINQLEVM